MRSNGKRRPYPSVIAVMAQLLLVSLAGCGGRKEAPQPVVPADFDIDGIADANDCAPQDAQAWRILDYASRDEDTDSYRVNAAGQICAGAALPATLSATAVSATDADCDDTNGARWATRTYAARDDDGDSFGVASSGDVCTGAALPDGLFATMPATIDLDCDDASASVWRLLTFASRDMDADGFRVNESGSQCGQETLAAHLNAAATTAVLADCDDTDRSVWRRMAIYSDMDGDGTGSGTPLRRCIGSTVPDGYVLTGYDPLDDPDDPSSVAVSTLVQSSSALAVPDETDDDDVL
jgi:hypothetical protein